jgi:hypothetical protein
MAATKKGSTGKKAAGAKAGKGATKAKGAAKATKTKSATKKKAPAKKAAPAKLSDRQRDLLGKIHGAGAAGYGAGAKAEQRTIDALVGRKLVKRGAKDKASGHFHYLLTKAGEKHLAAPAPAPAPATTAPAATNAAAPAPPPPAL